METRDSPHLLQSILNRSITVYLYRVSDGNGGYRLEMRDVETTSFGADYKRPCTADEVNAYQEFASLSLDERRRSVIAKFIEDHPYSEFTRAVMTGRYLVPKKRGRKSSTAVKSTGKGGRKKKPICSH